MAPWATALMFLPVPLCWPPCCPVTQQAYSCPRTFARAVSSAQNALPPVIPKAWVYPLLPSGLCSDGTLFRRTSYPHHIKHLFLSHQPMSFSFLLTSLTFYPEHLFPADRLNTGMFTVCLPFLLQNLRSARVFCFLHSCRQPST